MVIYMNEKIKKIISNDGKGVKIVILDSGVCLSHPRLSAHKIYGYNFIDNSLDIEDYLGHGTAVTGIINQHVPKSDIYLIKLFDYDYTIEFEKLCRALEYINENVDFDILNLSVGITECPDHERLERLCLLLSEKGIIISAFDNFGAVSYPAAYSCVIGVDSNTKYTNSFDYDFIDDETITIRGKGGNQRLLWNKSNYIIQSGSSFACAHITALVAKIIQDKKLNMKEILYKLREYATVVFEPQTYEENIPAFEIKRAICFPYNKEIDTLCRNESQLTFELVGIYDSKLNFNGGKMTRYGKIIKNIEQLNWDDDFDTVILGHVSDLSDISKVDYYNYIRMLCSKHNKNLFQFDPIENSPKIYSPNILNSYLPPLNFGKMHLIGKPTVAILGTSSCQGKFSLQLALRKEFIAHGYTVGQLGTEPQSILFGFDETFPCGYGTKLNLNEQIAIGYINHLLYKIERKNPDIIIVGGQSGLVPYAMYNLGNNSPYQRDLLLASSPDAIVLCVNYFDEIEYIQRTINYAESLTGSKVVALSIFPFDKAFSWSTVSSSLKLINPELLDLQIEFLEKEIGVKVYTQSQTKQLCKELIRYFSEDIEIEESDLLLSLLPFIKNDEISYYRELNENVLTLLISVAPFVGKSDNLHKLSRLTLDEIEKATVLFPIMNEKEKEDYFNKFESV